MNLYVNVAATCVGTNVLGPRTRSVVWVQGCPFRCANCLAPSWIPFCKARLVTPEKLAAELLADPAVSGLTFSGGEPMQQAPALAAVARIARRERPLTVICFSGYRLDELRDNSAPDGAAELLQEVDVLIDGRYVAALDDDQGLRGSSNQRIHHLTDALHDYRFDFEHGQRSAEIHLDNRELLLVGVPPRGLADRLDELLDDLAGSQGSR